MKKILVADDSATARMILIRCLEMVGFKQAQFLEAKDGQEALEIAAKEMPALIVADLNMPRMDGESLVKNLKAVTETRAIPVVIASSAVNPVKNERLQALGVLGILAKPVSPAALKQALGAMFAS